MNSARIGSGLWIAIAIALCSVNAQAQHRKSLDVDKAGVIAHWTKERRANAIPRDLVIDPRGLGYLRQPDGSLRPYGHDISAQVGPTNQAVSPFGKPVADPGDITPPSITDMDPSPGVTIGSTYTFKATVTDDLSGIKSVTFNIVKEGSTFVNSFSATKDSGDVWSVGPLYPSDGSWTWWVEAKDGAGKGGNSATSNSVKFTVSSGDANNNTNQDVITNDQWSGGAVQTAAGRLYFEMPSNSKRKGPWTGYVCSGTVATDNTITIDDTTGKQTVNDHGRSVIITAAHCVYDDVNKAFARNVMFIPNQAGTSGTRTDRDCSNDPLGCWVPSFGVVDVEWTKWTFPDNMKWDYAYYVVSDDGAHSEATTGDPASGSSALDSVAGSLPVSFVPPLHDRNDADDRTDFAFALGYSYSEDPKFMYCAEDMTTKAYNNQTVNWWLPGCGLSGGSSGGPWVQKTTTNDPTTWDGNRGDGVNIISVNSWGYTSSPGMAGPMLAPLTPPLPTTSSASCVFDSAKSTSFESVASTDGDAGKVVTCP